MILKIKLIYTNLSKTPHTSKEIQHVDNFFKDEKFTKILEMILYKELDKGKFMHLECVV